MSTETPTWLREAGALFRQQRQLAGRAIAQLSDDELFRSAGAGDNSVAVLMKHVGGNLRSRWTEPFTTDGEKPDRNRDSEFVVTDDDAASVRRVWEGGWGVLESFLDDVGGADLQRTLTVRGQAMSLEAALLRSLAHTAQHVGQIVLLAKLWRGQDWQTLSIPRDRSAEFLRRPPQ